MVRLFGNEYRLRELQSRTGNLAQLAAIDSGQYVQGKGRGGRFVDVRNASGLEFRVLPDRGMDIGDLRFDGVSLGWRSANCFADSRTVDPDLDQGTGVLAGLDGFLVTCGLDHVRGPYTGSGTHFGNRTQFVRYPMHGRIWNQSAIVTDERMEWSDEGCVMELSGEVRQSTLYRENLLLRRTIRTGVADASFEIHDTVINEGFTKVPHMLMYHINLGFPFFAEASELYLGGRQEAKLRPPWTSQPAQNADELWDFPVTAAQRRTVLANRNLHSGIGLAIDFEGALERLQVWRNMTPGWNVIAIEPATNRAVPRDELETGNEIRWLMPGEQTTYRVCFSLFRGREDIDAAINATVKRQNHDA